MTNAWNSPLNPLEPAPGRHQESFEGWELVSEGERLKQANTDALNAARDDLIAFCNCFVEIYHTAQDDTAWKCRPAGEVFVEVPNMTATEVRGQRFEDERFRSSQEAILSERMDHLRGQVLYGGGSLFKTFYDDFKVLNDLKARENEARNE